MDASRDFVKSRTLESGIFAKPPFGAEGDLDTVRGRAKPIYGAATSVKGRYLTLRDSTVIKCGRKVDSLDNAFSSGLKKIRIATSGNV